MVYQYSSRNGGAVLSIVQKCDKSMSGWDHPILLKYYLKVFKYLNQVGNPLSKIISKSVSKV